MNNLLLILLLLGNNNIFNTGGACNRNATVEPPITKTVCTTPCQKVCTTTCETVCGMPTCETVNVYPEEPCCGCGSAPMPVPANNNGVCGNTNGCGCNQPASCNCCGTMFCN